MNVTEELLKAWDPHKEVIRAALTRLAHAPMPEGADFLWFVLRPNELIGMPIIVWPTGRDQQQYDQWDCERELIKAVPPSVTFPDELTGSVEAIDQLRNEVAQYLLRQWCAIVRPQDRLAYFSIDEDGYYFSLQDGRKISAWKLEEEIGEASSSSP